jgi:hypothetical protein
MLLCPHKIDFISTQQHILGVCDHPLSSYVKLAYGGSKYSMSTFIQTNEVNELPQYRPRIESFQEVAVFCEMLKGVQEELGIDGVDFYIENADTSAELQIEASSLHISEYIRKTNDYFSRHLKSIYALIQCTLFPTSRQMFRACRELVGPDFHMSFTIAALGGGFQPWNAVLAGYHFLSL